MEKTGVARFAVVLIIVLGGCSFQGAIETETVTVSPNDTGIHRVTEKAPETETIAVLQVIDGDTCRLEDGRYVRYLGIDAPEEGDPRAKEARLANNRLVGGKTVRLEFGRSRQDKYDRLLAYVFVDDTFVNEILLRQGLVHLRHPVAERYRARLQRAQDEARAAGVGIWAPAATGRSIALAFVHEDAHGDDRRNLNDEFIVIENQGQHPIDLTGWTVSDAADHRYLFPNFALASKAQVTLRTGLGRNTERELFWGRRNSVWNNNGDTVFIRDSQGYLVLSYVY
jgi:micrococcal nuclease